MPCPLPHPQATPERLLDHLLEESVDDNYHMDFLLTYRTFLSSPDPIIEKLLKAWNERVDLRKRVKPCNLYMYMHICCRSNPFTLLTRIGHFVK